MSLHGETGGREPHAYLPPHSRPSPGSRLFQHPAVRPGLAGTLGRAGSP